MKPIEVGPWQLAAPDSIHRRDVQPPPGISQSLPVTVNATQRAQAPSLGGYSCTPIHGGAKYIEREGTHVSETGGPSVRLAAQEGEPLTTSSTSSPYLRSFES